MTTTSVRPPTGYAPVRERLHTLLWRQKISHAMAGSIVGVSASTFGKKLRGETVMTVEELLKLAGFLGVDPAELVEGCAIRDSNPEPAGLARLWSVTAPIKSLRLAA